MNVRIIKVMARFGTPSPVIGAFMIGISILYANQWSFTQDTLGALGVMGSGSAIIYNSGLLMAGSTAMLLAAGLFEFTQGDIIGQVGSAIFLAYSVLVCILGISILDLGNWIKYVSPAVYLMIPLCSILLAYSFYEKGMTIESLVGALPGIVGITIWAFGGPVTAVNQIISLLPFSLWQIMFGFYMFRIEFNQWN